MIRAITCLFCLSLLLPFRAARASDDPPAGDGGAATAPPATAAWSVHLQTTFVDQYHPSLAAAYSGNNSLSASANSENTSDATVYLGRRLWRGGEFYINEEVDQGWASATPSASPASPAAKPTRSDAPNAISSVKELSCGKLSI